MEAEIFPCFRWMRLRAKIIALLSDCAALKLRRSSSAGRTCRAKIIVSKIHLGRTTTSLKMFDKSKPRLWPTTAFAFDCSHKQRLALLRSQVIQIESERTILFNIHRQDSDPGAGVNSRLGVSCQVG